MRPLMVVISFLFGKPLLMILVRDGLIPEEIERCCALLNGLLTNGLGDPCVQTLMIIATQRVGMIGHPGKGCKDFMLVKSIESVAGGAIHSPVFIQIDP